MYGGARMSSTRVIIVSNDDSYKTFLKRIFISSGYSIIGEVNNQSAALRLIKSRTPDLVIVDGDCIDINVIDLIDIIEQDLVSTLIVLSHQMRHQLVEKAKESWSFSYSLKQVPEAMLISSIEVAIAQFKRYKKMEQEIDKLKKTLETRKLVDKAKGLLMDKLKLSEDQAFRHIQKISMDRSLPMKEVANAIIISYS